MHPDEARIRAKLNTLMARHLMEQLTPQRRSVVRHEIEAALHDEPAVADEASNKRHIIVQTYADAPHLLVVDMVSDIKLEARLIHDCQGCTYLGSCRGHDLYFCGTQIGDPTVIARYGDDGPEYMSGLPFGQRPSLRDDEDGLKALRIAYILLSRLGLHTKVRGYIWPEEA